jgi:hypothetical protein
MFQVASHPVHAQIPSHMAHQHHARNPVQLPRTLTRPQPRDPSPQAIAAVEPELANIPLEYIRTGLRDMGDT